MITVMLVHVVSDAKSYDRMDIARQCVTYIYVFTSFYSCTITSLHASMARTFLVYIKLH